MKSSASLAALCAVAAVVGAFAERSAQANLLVNGSFEANDASASPFFLRYQGATTGQLTGWNTILDGVDLIHNTYTQGPAVLVDAQDGVQFLDMNSLGVLGGVTQAVSVTPGELYGLTIYGSKWATNSGGSIRYSLIDGIGGSVIATSVLDLSTTTGWVLASLEGRALSGTLQVRVEAASTVQAGPGLDNVTLVAIPEPGTAGVLGISSGLMLIARRRRA